MAITRPAERSIERRAENRQRTNLEGVIVCKNAHLLRCTVKNVSPMGALLSFDCPTIIPDCFKLIIPEHWFEAECQIRHRSVEEKVGVFFTTNRREALARFGCQPG